MTTIRLYSTPAVDPQRLSCLQSRWGFTVDTQAAMALVLTETHLELRKCDEPMLGAVWVDFVAGRLAHRRRFGGGRGEALAKAVGIRKNYFPNVVDVTAGLGRDAFVLAALGCHVQMVERDPVIAALLYDGLQRGYHDPEIGTWLKQRLTLTHASGITVLQQLSAAPEVIYLDPMYPPRMKSALVKKEMRLLQELLVEEKTEMETLLRLARHIAQKRVVVKRPNYASPLAEMLPSGTVKTKNHRFDLYTPLL